MLHNSVKSLKITEFKVLVAQSYPTLCDPMDCSLTGFSVHEILQAIILQWVAIPFSMGTSWPRDRTQASCIAADSLPPEPPEKPQITELYTYKWKF